MESHVTDRDREVMCERLAERGGSAAAKNVRQLARALKPAGWSTTRAYKVLKSLVWSNRRKRLVHIERPRRGQDGLAHPPEKCLVEAQLIA